MKNKPVYERLRMIRACLHECEAIMNDFLEGKRSYRHLPFGAEDDSDPVKVRKGISRVIVDIDQLSLLVESDIPETQMK